MLKKIKYTTPLCVALLGIANAAAQAPIEREVDVTRPYEPSVRQSLKLNRMPDMTDTAQMRPDFRYEITPRPLEYGFDLEPLNAARFAAVEAMPRPLYVKLGLGAPLRSVAEARYTAPLADKRFDFGAYATHTGRYGRTENDMGIRESAFGTDNRAGARFGFRPADGFSIDADAGYRFRNVTRYGYYGPETDLPFYDLSDDALKQFFHNPHLKISAGSDFDDLRRVGARVGGGMDYVADRYKYDQTRWELDALIGFRTGNHGLITLGTQAGFTRGKNNLNDYKNEIVKAEAAWTYDFDGFRARIGLGLGGSATTLPDGAAAADRTAFLPRLTLEKELFEGLLTPFLALRSEIEDNSFGELIKRNPYVFSGTTAPNTVAYRSQAGVKGVFGNIRYKLYAGHDRLLDNFYWVNAQEYSAMNNAFATLTDSLSIFQAGAEVQAEILDVLTLHGAFRYAQPNSERYAEAGGVPDWRAEAGAAYNYRNRLWLSAGVEAIGPRTMYEWRYAMLYTHRLPSQLDLRLGAEYRIDGRLAVFVQVNNLLNDDLYEFNRFRELGINGLAGIEITF